MARARASHTVNPHFGTLLAAIAAFSLLCLAWGVRELLQLR
jgi:hypothetical protein